MLIHFRLHHALTLVTLIEVGGYRNTSPPTPTYLGSLVPTVFSDDCPTLTLFGHFLPHSHNVIIFATVSFHQLDISFKLEEHRTSSNRGYTMSVLSWIVQTLCSAFKTPWLQEVLLAFSLFLPHGVSCLLLFHCRVSFQGQLKGHFFNQAFPWSPQLLVPFPATLPYIHFVICCLPRENATFLMPRTIWCCFYIPIAHSRCLINTCWLCGGDIVCQFPCAL